MKDDIRYSEFLFLRALERHDRKFENVFINHPEQQSILGLQQRFYQQMVVALAEDGYVDFDQQDLQLLVGRILGEIAADFRRPSGIHDFEWGNPRECLRNKLLNGGFGIRVQLTYRGLCRIEELRELLKRDRILEPFGVLLDLRYFLRDLEEALHRPSDVAVSVLRLDMDNFKRINDEYGHAAGDVVMKSFLETVRSSLGSVGDAYRGRGDEVAALIVGLEHERAIEIAENIRRSIENLQCEFKGSVLPPVTSSIGLATTPPESRGTDMETLADDRQNRAKKLGKNRVVWL
jgi:diguanylate cyclase (GGDEF)-like protein